MYNSIYPIFTPNRVLKRESIEYLRDFPHDLVSLAYESYSDGVLFGFSVRLANEQIVVSKGAVKYQGCIITVPETEVLFEKYDRGLCIKLVIGECRKTEDYEVRAIELALDEARTSAGNEIELGRFRLTRGAVLRCEYDSIDDFCTQENTLDITHVPYAGHGTQTLHPKILRAVGSVLLENSLDAVDIAFGMMCLNADIIHKESIQWYLAQKTGGQYVDYTIDKLYEKLALVLRKNRRGDGRLGYPGSAGKRRTPNIS